MKKSKEIIDFTANPNNIEIGDWVIKDKSNLVGLVESQVNTNKNMLQYWVKWFNERSSIPTPELPVNLQKTHVLENNCMGIDLLDGKITAIRKVGKSLKYELTTNLGTPRLLTPKQVEKMVNQDVKIELPTSIAVKDIVVDYKLQQRVELNQEVVEDYSLLYQSETHLPPITIVLCYDKSNQYYLVDGFHRVEGAKLAGIEKLSCKCLEGSYREAIIYSVSANDSHGLRRSQADKRKAVLTLLSDEEWKELSTRKLAEMASVSHQLVHNIRKEIKDNFSNSNESLDNQSISELENDINDKSAKKQLDLIEYLLPPDVKIKSKKSQTYTIEVKQSTLDRIQPYLDNDNEQETVESVINFLIDKIEQSLL